MPYFKEIHFTTEGKEAVLYVTDHAEEAGRLRREGEAVLIYLHQGNTDQDFSRYLFAVEDPEDLEQEYVERVYRRLKGLPWHILDTDRCLVRETTPEDVGAFYQIYSDPAITRYMEGLYPEEEQERRYIREYIEKVYTYHGFGVWTVVDRDSGAVIGRAGFSYREDFPDPELGYIIGVPWQRQGYGTEVCRAVLGYGWGALEFEQVQALVETENQVSLRLCEKLGFRYEKSLALQGKNYHLLLCRRKTGSTFPTGAGPI